MHRLVDKISHALELYCTGAFLDVSQTFDPRRCNNNHREVRRSRLEIVFDDMVEDLLLLDCKSSSS